MNLPKLNMVAITVVIVLSMFLFYVSVGMSRSTRVRCGASNNRYAIPMNVESCPLWELYEPSISIYKSSLDKTQIADRLVDNLFLIYHVDSQHQGIFSVKYYCCGGMYTANTIVAVNTVMHGCRPGEDDYLNPNENAGVVALGSLTWGSLFWIVLIVRLCTPRSPEKKKEKKKKSDMKTMDNSIGISGDSYDSEMDV